MITLGLVYESFWTPARRESLSSWWTSERRAAASLEWTAERREAHGKAIKAYHQAKRTKLARHRVRRDAQGRALRRNLASILGYR